MRSDDDKKRTAALQRLARAKRQRNHVRYKIKLQWRNPLGCVGDPTDWRSWRVFGSIPILFHTEQEAWDYITAYPIFLNAGRKASASVERITTCHSLNRSRVTQRSS